MLQYIINDYYESFLDKNKEKHKETKKENKKDMGTSIKMTCAANKVVKMSSIPAKIMGSQKSL